MLTVLWFVYPLFLFIDPDGSGLINSTTDVALIAVLDLLSKPVYGLLSIAGTSRIVAKEQRADGVGTSTPLGPRRAA